MSNTKISEELNFQVPNDSVAPSYKIEKSRYDLVDKEAPKDSVSSSDKIKKPKEYLLVPSTEID